MRSVLKLLRTPIPTQPARLTSRHDRRARAAPTTNALHSINARCLRLKPRSTAHYPLHTSAVSCFALPTRQHTSSL
eukprot:CAMPEP_0185833938 /NCGR_PEP_ID=MMETSP1353-20130828/3662_1 /TAXON_ID=1077150 /ORGANISM="Erythrolobus australicus, Strain CCMP3124" /LENGTH=75 /DNA_ID=CAMNT_0028532283 /DNA_START=357 /DNA_END=581 /DNA_ORIENTATION=+